MYNYSAIFTPNPHQKQYLYSRKRTILKQSSAGYSAQCRLFKEHHAQ